MKLFLAAILCTLFCLPLAAEIDGWGQSNDEPKTTKRRASCDDECRQQRRQAIMMYMMMQRGYQPAYQLPPVQVYRPAPAYVPQISVPQQNIQTPASTFTPLQAPQLHSAQVPNVQPRYVPAVPAVAPPPPTSNATGYAPSAPKPLGCVGVSVGNGVIAMQCQKQ